MESKEWNERMSSSSQSQWPIKPTTCTRLASHTHTPEYNTESEEEFNPNDGVRSQKNSPLLCAATAAAACRRGPRGGQLLPGRGHHVGRRARQDRRRRRPPHAVARQGLRLRVPVQEPVPVRPLRHADQARPRRLRRHRRHFLPVVAGFGARRDRLRVPGERERAALHGAHQRVQPGQGRPGAAVPHVVRPHRRLPHLLRRLEPHTHPVLRGRDADPGAPEPGGGDGGGVPAEPGDAGVRQRVGRGGVGDAGRAGEDGLVAGAVRGVLQGLRRERVHVAGRGGVRQLQRRLDVPGAGLHGAGPTPVGAEELHDLQLLRGHLEVQGRRPARVRHQVECCIWKRRCGGRRSIL